MSFTVGGSSVSEHLTKLAESLAGQITDSLTSDLDTYASLPPEEISSDITRSVLFVLRTFATVAETGEQVPPETLAPLAESAGRRAEEGVPLGQVLTAYHHGALVPMRELMSGAAPGDLADVLALHELLIEYLARVTEVVAEGYLRAVEEALGDERDSRRDLLGALLDGSNPREAATRAGITLPERFAVLSLAFGTHPDERRKGVQASVAMRRKVRRIRHELHVFAPDALSTLGGEAGIVLVPLSGTRPALDEWAALKRLIRHMGRAAGASVMAAGSFAVPDNVAQAVAESAQVLDVARRFGHGDGLYRIDDLLMEFQLSQLSAATGHLASLLDPLENDAVAFETLQVHVSSGLNRRRTATALHVHPNTVDNRLRKACALIGVDLASPSDVARLMAAFAARRRLTG